eukprot:CAMPEP_0118870720 /NCGR_PEP_ID=MMETSP1163-20130328/13550_1 /TAXON_ID=124430 /ORGANISM="Phaeomonas parva, Strain CCMP2877" /LENGTH=99 /DNA_ID=CAMNT_0006805747 /DNA_START=180 /DNA_END=480 /DNA_ORIENTATION=+
MSSMHHTTTDAWTISAGPAVFLAKHVPEPEPGPEPNPSPNPDPNPNPDPRPKPEPNPNRTVSLASALAPAVLRAHKLGLVADVPKSGPGFVVGRVAHEP